MQLYVTKQDQRNALLRSCVIYSSYSLFLFHRVKSRRHVVGPNYGFLSQLKLYEIMGYKIDKQNLFYKRFRLQVCADKVKSGKRNVLKLK